MIADHRRACDGFSTAVRSAAGRWLEPSPCTEWDARGILEHVISLHDALLLAPLHAVPERPSNGPDGRWAVTAEAIFAALSRQEVLDDERQGLLADLTTEVLVHTWDLGKAVRTGVHLDEDLCRRAQERALANGEQILASGLFGPRVPVADNATAQDRLVAVFGRDPRWSPPQQRL